jgi:hypothetical protein
MHSFAAVERRGGKESAVPDHPVVGKAAEAAALPGDHSWEWSIVAEHDFLPVDIARRL